MWLFFNYSFLNLWKLFSYRCWWMNSGKFCFQIPLINKSQFCKWQEKGTTSLCMHCVPFLFFAGITRKAFSIRWKRNLKAYYKVRHLGLLQSATTCYDRVRSCFITKCNSFIMYKVRELDYKVRDFCYNSKCDSFITKCQIFVKSATALL